MRLGRLAIFLFASLLLCASMFVLILLGLSIILATVKVGSWLVAVLTLALLVIASASVQITLDALAKKLLY